MENVCHAGTPVSFPEEGVRTTSGGLRTTSGAIVVVVCGDCGNPLKPKKRGSGHEKEYCSTKCRARAWRARRRAERLQETQGETVA